LWGSINLQHTATHWLHKLFQAEIFMSLSDILKKNFKKSVEHCRSIRQFFWRAIRLHRLLRLELGFCLFLFSFVKVSCFGFNVRSLYATKRALCSMERDLCSKNRDLFCMKRDLCSMKKAPRFMTRDQCCIKTALCFMKRALYNKTYVP